MIVTTCTNWRQESGQAIGHRARGSLIRDSIWNWFIVFVLVRCRPCSQEMPSGINGKCLCLCLDFKCHIIWLGSITNLSGKRVTVIHFISYFYNDKKNAFVLYCIVNPESRMPTVDALACLAHMWVTACRLNQPLHSFAFETLSIWVRTGISNNFIFRIHQNIHVDRNVWL